MERIEVITARWNETHNELFPCVTNTEQLKSTHSVPQSPEVYPEIALYGKAISSINRAKLPTDAQNVRIARYMDQPEGGAA